MHAHDRTMLANFGFADPDKFDPRHDPAIQYIATPAVRERLMRRVADPILAADRRAIQTATFRGKSWTAVESLEPPVFECPLSKGERQYKSTVGFLDVVLPYSVRWATTGEELHEGRSFRGPNGWMDTKEQWKPSEKVEIIPHLIVVEVKASYRSLGDVLRQFNLYREFADHGQGPVNPRPGEDRVRRQWVLATLFPVDDEDAATLKVSDIHHVVLGPSFDTWLAEREARRNRLAGGGPGGPGGSGDGDGLGGGRGGDRQGTGIVPDMGHDLSFVI